MKFFNRALGMTLAVMLVGNWGCSKSDPQQEAKQAQAEQARVEKARMEKAQAEQARLEKARADFEKAVMACDQLMQDGKLAEATALLEGALADKTLSDFKTEIFQRLLFSDLTSDNVPSAQARYRAMQTENPGIARQCLGMIEGNLFEGQKFAELGQWVDSLLVGEKDEATVTALVRWQFRAARAQKTANAAVTALTPVGSRLAPATWRGLAGEFGSVLIQEGAAGDVDQLIEFLGGKEASDPEIGPLRISLQISLWVSQQKWAQAVDFVKGLAAKTADAPFNGYSVQVADPLRRAQQNEQLVALCKWALYDLQGKPAARETAAQMYVRNAVEIEDVPLSITRINELKAAQFDVLHVARWMDLAYSVSMKKGQSDDFKALLTLGEEIMPGLKDREQANVAGIILDVSFRLDRFETALKVLEAGVSGQDKAWHASMINKVKAHLDVQQGRPLEAAEKFIKFLDESASKMEPTIDPITGDLITREMVQGLNAKRIADLLKKGGKDAEATAYYLKSKQYYTASLKGMDPTSSRAKKTQAELASLPQ